MIGRMAPVRPAEFVVECLWPGVQESDLDALEERASRCAEKSASVRYLGSLWMREDEVVLCMFAGQLEAVRETAQAAHIPFERILEAARSPWGESEESSSAVVAGPRGPESPQANEIL